MRNETLAFSLRFVVCYARTHLTQTEVTVEFYLTILQSADNNSATNALRKARLVKLPCVECRFDEVNATRLTLGSRVSFSVNLLSLPRAEFVTPSDTSLFALLRSLTGQHSVPSGFAHTKGNEPDCIMTKGV